MSVIRKIESDCPGNVEVQWEGGSGLALRDYAGPVSGAGDLVHGQTHTFDDGCTVTRVGDKTIWWTPPSGAAAPSQAA